MCLLVQRAAGQGKDYNTVPLHKCQCPPCFESSLLGGCKPKCDLETCDLSNGVCSGTTYAGEARLPAPAALPAPVQGHIGDQRAVLTKLCLFDLHACVVPGYAGATWLPSIRAARAARAS